MIVEMLDRSRLELEIAKSKSRKILQKGSQPTNNNLSTYLELRWKNSAASKSCPEVIQSTDEKATSEQDRTNEQNNNSEIIHWLVGSMMSLWCSKSNALRGTSTGGTSFTLSSELKQLNIRHVITVAVVTKRTVRPRKRLTRSNSDHFWSGNDNRLSWELNFRKIVLWNYMNSGSTRKVFKPLNSTVWVSFARFSHEKF
jgi:hypothetical protein